MGTRKKTKPLPGFDGVGDVGGENQGRIAGDSRGVKARAESEFARRRKEQAKRAAAQRAQVYEYPTLPACPWCRSTMTIQTSTQAPIQWRKCMRCDRSFKNPGELVY